MVAIGTRSAFCFVAFVFAAVFFANKRCISSRIGRSDWHRGRYYFAKLLTVGKL